MLTIECPDHGSPVMVPETRVRGLRNTAAGILLEVECWCGARVAIHTGRRARHRRSGLELVSEAAHGDDVARAGR